MGKAKVLFVCSHNSARSQMAEAFFNNISGDNFIAESAGLEPGNLNPVVVEAMKEVGIDISNNTTKDVFDFYKQGRLFSYVVTVCDKAGEKCPIFPGKTTRINWSFDDPSSFTGTYEEKLEKTIKVRDEIKEKVENFYEQLK